MRTAISRARWVLLEGMVLTLAACGSEANNDSSVASSTSASSNASNTMASSANSSTSSVSSATGTADTTNGSSTSSGTDGAVNTSTGTRGGTSGTASTGAGGASTETAVTTSSTGDTGTGCSVGPWPATEPASPGPFGVITEENVGPLAGEGGDGEPVAFTLFRPEELGQNGLCHPVITWGNGTGSSPSLYGVLLRHLASHGFVVIASNSPNVASGDPPPMVAGVSWVIEQNDDPTSPLYRQIDVQHVGATGHSQGGFATSVAGGDDQVTTIAPLCGAAAQRNLHGPALLLCGGMDEVVPCSTVQNAFNATDDQPVMLANYLTADHADWVTFRGTELSPVETAVVAWMRVHLMDDTSLRPWFYGASCGLCTDSAWEISQKLMDE